MKLTSIAVGGTILTTQVKGVHAGGRYRICRVCTDKIKEGQGHISIRPYKGLKKFFHIGCAKELIKGMATLTGGKYVEER